MTIWLMVAELNSIRIIMGHWRKSARFSSESNTGTTYVLWAIPYKEEKGYRTEELVAVEIPVPALTYDGTATINISGVVTTVSSVSATITPELTVISSIILI